MTWGIASYETRIRWIAALWAILTTFLIMCPLSWTVTFIILGGWIAITVIPSLAFAWWRPRVTRGVPIFLRFVSVGETPNASEPEANTIRPRELDRLIYNLLIAGYQFQTVDEALVAPARKSIVMTFDGGYRDIVHQLLPILKKHNVKATCFITNRCDVDARYLKALEIQEVLRSGLVTFSSYLPEDVPATEAKEFLTVNRNWLIGITRHIPSAVAVASKQMNPSLQAVIQEVGFKAAFITHRKMYPVADAPYAIHRQPILRDYHGWQAYFLVTRGRWRAF
ncbi:MAG: polysaccharide deacetylase family protein [bacterium]|nr:polysaccharide deacetylase family protein [bacterium]